MWTRSETAVTSPGPPQPATRHTTEAGSAVSGLTPGQETAEPAGCCAAPLLPATELSERGPHLARHAGHPAEGSQEGVLDNEAHSLQ